MAIPLTSESAPPPAALIDGDQMSIVELREAEDSEIAAGGGRKGKRAEYYCAACGYGIVVYGQPPSCPMCSEARWEHVEWRPFSQLLDDLALPSDGGGIDDMVEGGAEVLDRLAGQERPMVGRSLPLDL